MTIRFRALIVSACLALTFQGITAAPRTLSQMKSAAANALQSSRIAATASSQELKTVFEKGPISLIGYTDGPYVVVSSDDRFPAVLGISKTSYSEGKNANFEYWLNAMAGALTYRAENNMPAQIIAPDPSLYPVSVGPLCTSTWDQLTPYNNLLPSGIYTGCVATAMAQVLYYHKAPECGTGSRTIYAKGTPVIANFSEDYYDWDNMRDSYKGGYSETEANAVALLMRDCGVAANMQYGNAWDGGSGAYSQDAAEGLREYLNMPEAVCLERDDYSENDWMDLVFNELANVGPLYYGGSDMALWSGHAFVLHGYNEDGLVYVNWGWSGDDDGWYDISLLNPTGYKFSAQQDMILGVRGYGTKATQTDTVNVEKAGQLAEILLELVPSDSLDRIAGLKISGEINADDLRLLRQLSGCDDEMNLSRGTLRSLDLSEASIVGGGGYFLKVGNRQITTSAKRIPEMAFYGCRSLKQLILPSDIISIGKGAFALCNSLDSIGLPPSDNTQDFVVKSNTIYQKSDTTTIFIVLPTARGNYIVDVGKTAIDDYAFAGCARLNKIQLPSTVTKIGDYAFQNCTALQEIRLAQKEVPETGLLALDGVRTGAAKLYIPAGSKDLYKNHPEWGRFIEGNKDNIVEYGSAIVARNAGRDYGEENPPFGYQISGDRPEGKPELTCDATPESPVGNYVIHVERGTITDEIVDFIDGTLVIWKAKLKVSVGDYTRYVGQENPEFELTYDGFKLDETPDVLTVKPVATTTATIDSPEGEYPITISGGEAQNYEFRYTAGTLKVTADPDAIRNVYGADSTFDVYSVDGILIRKGVTSLDGLPNGVYLVNGRKHVVR